MNSACGARGASHARQGFEDGSSLTLSRSPILLARETARLTPREADMTKSVLRALLAGSVGLCACGDTITNVAQNPFDSGTIFLDGGTLGRGGRDAATQEDAAAGDAATSEDAGSDAGVDASTPVDAGADAGGDASMAEDSTSAATSSKTPTFTQVYAILRSKCSPCHTQDDIANQDFSTQGKAYTQLVNHPAAGPACSGDKRVRVIPGKPDQSLIIQKLRGTQNCGSRMPFGRAPLPKATIDEIVAWIKAGARNT
jgi:hypothetical protein